VGDKPVTAFVALLRAVNVGGTGLIKMADLKAICEGLGFRKVRTLLQSGNVAFLAKGSDKSVAKKLADAIENSHGFRPTIMVRTADEIAGAMKRNPFPAAAETEPNRLLVSFLASPPAKDAAERLAAIKVDKEKLRLVGNTLYVDYAEGGMGTSKIGNTVLERALGVPATARNWNTVTKLLKLAREMEG
jgi:uncharacterized protein (DUF1697 family)